MSVEFKRIEVPVQGMDCADCTMHVRHALEALQGVQQVEVFLGAEKAVLQLDPQQVTMDAIRQAVVDAGYSVPEIRSNASSDINAEAQTHAGRAGFTSFTRPILTLLGVVFGAVLFIIVVGEWLGLFEALTERVPLALGALIVLAFGFPVLRNVVRAALRGQIISHTLMSLGVIAALMVGEWATAAVVVFFMRVGDYVESFTTERARRAVKDLTAMTPQTARVERDGSEIELPAAQVQAGDVVILRPGEQVPVDGKVLAGYAALNQAAITGESLPVDAGPGSLVYAATLVQSGALRVRAGRVGADTTFGRVIRLVEQAEANKAQVQRVADRFSAWYLPVVAGIAALTFFLRRDPLATAAVLVVACSCSFALATPIAMLASIGAGARHGLMIKGGRYLELLDQADVLLIDKTGTLTLGRPVITEIEPAGELAAGELLRLAASAERYSEHPLAEAVRQAAFDAGLKLDEPGQFESIAGQGIRAFVAGQHVSVGSRRMMADNKPYVAEMIESDSTALHTISDETGKPNTESGAMSDHTWMELEQRASRLQNQGRSVLFVAIDSKPAGLLAASDTLRPDAPHALAELRQLGFTTIELLTGDNEGAARALVERLDPALGVRLRANLLPEDKIEAVRRYQSGGHRVVMIGDGVNDAPALAQADIGIAMGAAGSDIAIEAAHIALMRDDWMLVPQVVRIARRTLRVVKANIAFTALYNTVGLTLAALGFLPPILAAAAQSLPDLGILANSSRLIKGTSK